MKEGGREKKKERVKKAQKLQEEKHTFFQEHRIPHPTLA